MNIDFKSESFRLSQKHGCVPACVVEAIMRDTADLMVADFIETIRGIRDGLQAAQKNNFSNGQTKLIQA